MTSKDEALKMAIELCRRIVTKEEIPVWYARNTHDACKEALKQPTIAELNDEYLRDTYVEGLNQPAQGIELAWYVKGWDDAKKDSRVEQLEQEVECSNHPDAPHGFCRDASHSAGRYVCECEGWQVEQPAQEPLSNEEVTKLWAKFEIELVGCDIRDWTRVIEQAHGIGVK